MDTVNPQWLTADERRAWIALMALVEVLPSALDVQLKRDGGLTHFDYQVMAGLSDAPGHAIRMSDLALFTSGSLSRLSHAVSRLENRGLVERRACPSDPRYVEAVLSEAGLRVMEQVAPGHVAEVRRVVFDCLTQSQVAQLETIARRVIRASSPATGRLLDDGLDAGPDEGVVVAAARARAARESAEKA